VVDVIPVESYTSAVIRELETRSESLDGAEIASVFLGGGTPGLWGPEPVRRVLEAVESLFGSSTSREITIEVNPGECDETMLTAYREVSGCNRVSLGVQSLTDSLLVAMDRIHGADEARAAMRAVVEAGYEDWSADLIFGLPGQDLRGWLADLEEVLSYDSPHLSVYNLMVEEATPLYTMVRRGSVVLPAEEIQLDMLLQARERIEAAGLKRYEISNFARPGHGSRHNSLYWTGRPYLGIGAGAHGFVPDGRPGILGRREANVRKFVPYMEAIARDGSAIHSSEDIAPTVHVRERMMMGLRLEKGVDLAEVAAVTGIDPAVVMGTSLAALAAEDFLVFEGSVVRLTERGLPVSDAVFLRLFEAAA